MQAKELMRALRLRILIFSAVFVGIIAAPSPQRVLDRKLHHLRSGPHREWSEFSRTAEDSELTLTFWAAPTGKEQMLRLRQRDVRNVWKVILNGLEIGQLAQDENDLVSAWPLAPGRLLKGKNTLRIAASGDPADEILVGDIRIDDRPGADAFTEATVDVTVVDAESGKTLPCRLTVADLNGSLVPLWAESGQSLAVRTGMTYSGDGRAKFRIAAGQYTLYAGRGFEYGVSAVRLSLAPGQAVEKRLSIRREVPTPGLISCDTHTHTFTYSGHGDASVAERMLTIAGEGIELPVATDHNTYTDYDPIARQVGVRSFFSPVVGCEVTTPVGHFNIFPVLAGSRPPDPAQSDWPTVFEGIRSAGAEMVVLNHPRDLHRGYRPFGPEHHNALVGENLHGWTFEPNAMEVVNSGALQSDPHRLYKDWFGLLNRGFRVTPVGSSDSHDVGRKLLGQARTYIACGDDDPARVDLEAAFSSFRQGRVLVSFGLLTEIKVNGLYGPGDVVPAADSVKVAVRVLGPTWTSADRVALYSNGVKVREASIRTATRTGQSSVLKWQGQWILPPPGHDIHLVAIATGPGVDEPYWRIPKPYQPTTWRWAPYVIGSTGAVWIDAGGDGQPTSAYEYATRVVGDCGLDRLCLVRRLAGYDEAIAVQVANLLHKQGVSLWTELTGGALEGAAPATRRGLETFADALPPEKPSRDR